MALPSYIGSRSDWDAEQERKLREAYIGDDEGFRRAWAYRYPCSVPSAIAELKHRGLNATEDNFALFCDLDSLQRIGRNYVLRAEDVDRVAEVMFEAGKIGGLALRRKEMGFSYTEELEAIRRLLEARRQKAAELQEAK